MLETLKTLEFTAYVWLIVLPVAMMVIDVMTGLVNAWAKNDFQSTKMRSGLAKKVGEFMILLVGILFSDAFGLQDWILNLVALYIILMELMSIVENLDKLGVPLPRFIKDAINNIGQSLQNDELIDLNRKIEELENTIKKLTEE